ncbi:flagellar biosynthesis regulator FlaF [Pelagibacterium montanilacus]|uniref:flagellar biosynthesis regulator FlaF n=1 Tax=Pelagibacterium montanilacus TaxID=2185280 RepID=UPI0019CF5482|nr:flagellar biosynthesis regulator FlaF [Pelagibacterium montanilacus]
MAYQQTARQTANPRDLEASLLARSAAHLQRIRDDWESGESELNAALTYNRKLWTVLMQAVTREENPLPQPIKQNIANLGLFVMKQTLAATTRPEPGKLDALITINREIAAGLRAMPQAA